MLNEEMENGRRLERRRGARACLVALLGAFLAILGFLLLSPSREEIANALATAGPFLGPVVAALVAVVLAYYAASAYEATKR